MKLDDDQNGLARVDSSAAQKPMPLKANRRSEPMKRVSQHPSDEQLTPKPITDTANIKIELEKALDPILREIANREYNAAAELVNRFVPQVIAMRSAQSERFIANHVRDIAEEVAIESMETFSGVFANSEILINNMADDLLSAICLV